MLWITSSSFTISTLRRYSWACIGKWLNLSTSCSLSINNNSLSSPVLLLCRMPPCPMRRKECGINNLELSRWSTSSKSRANVSCNIRCLVRFFSSCILRKALLVDISSIHKSRCRISAYIYMEGLAIFRRWLTCMVC